RQVGRPPFTEEDQGMTAGFANQAAVALELAEARVERERLHMLDERERIAADLHDHVIQRLFAAGLSLQGVAARLQGPESAQLLGFTPLLRFTGPAETLVAAAHDASLTDDLVAVLREALVNVAKHAR